MKKIANMSLFVLLALLLYGGAAHAYQTWSADPVANTGNCATCHGDFNGGDYTSKTADDPATWGTNLMQGHISKFVLSCSDCHTSGSFSPVTLNSSSGITCSSCHGRTQDGPATGGLGVSKSGAGLRKRHAFANVTVCAGCHSTDPATPVAENIAPPTFLTKNINPCSDKFFGTAGLDNDGNGLRDSADDACPKPPPNILVAPLVANFGNVTVGNFVDRTVNISNTGGSNLTVTASLAAGSNPGFSIFTPPPATIAGGGSGSVVVRYTAADVSIATGTLQIASNDPDTPTVNVSLTANGGCAVLLECRVNIDPLALDFGALIAGDSSTKTVTISNQGTADCAIQTGTTGSTDFSATPPTLTVPPGLTGTVSVKYAPLAAGADAGETVINSNDNTQATVVVSLQGTADPQPPPGQTAYNSNCSGCHGDPKTSGPAPNSQIKVAGARTCSINAAIFGNPGASSRTSPYPAGVPGMAFLKSLTPQAILDISNYLNSFPVTGRQRYETACAGCHGKDARSGHVGQNIHVRDGYEIRRKIERVDAMEFLSCLPRSDTDQMGNYLNTLR